MVKALALVTFAGFFASALAEDSVSDTLGTTTTTTTAATSAEPAEQTLYGQCGGEGWTGPTVCQSPAVCVYGDPYHSTCVTFPVFTTTTTTTGAPPMQTLYGQCGGIAWPGPFGCVPPLNCKYSNPWFSQCLH